MVPHGRRRAVFAAILLLAAAALAAPARQSSLFEDIGPIMTGLSEITGWKVRRPVPAEFIGKPQLRSFLEKRIEEEVKPEDIRREELVLKMFGLVPLDFDLKGTTLELISEQAAAFYDPRRKTLSIIETAGPDNEKRAALVHELAHALADQQFHLERFIRKAGENDDASTARQAVMEGQATWLMWAYLNREAGGPATVGAASIAALEAVGDSTGSQYPALEKAPLYLRESLLFPYTRGLRFQDEVVRKLGRRGLTEVFERPPKTTREILHPDQYLSGIRAASPPLPALTEKRRYRQLIEGTIGEFDIQVLLRTHGPEEEARRIASEWRGGVFALHETKKAKTPLLSFSTDWSSAGAARDFFTAYGRVLREKHGRFEAGTDAEDRLTGRTVWGAFELRREGSRVTVLEGLQPPAIH